MARKDKLARLRAARKGGKIEDTDEFEDIYEEVDDLEYRKHKRDQLLNDDFVVDEEGAGSLGYAETGGDDWDQPHDYYSDEDDEDGDADEPKKKKKIRKVKKPTGPGIATFFNKTNKPKASASSTDGKPKKKISTDDILNDFNLKAHTSAKNTPFGLSSSSRKRDVFSSIKSEHRKPKRPSYAVKPLDFKKLMDDDDLRGSAKKQKLSSDPSFYTALDIDDSADFVEVPSSPSKFKAPFPIKKDNILDEINNNNEDYSASSPPQAFEDAPEPTEPMDVDDDDSDDSEDEVIAIARRSKASTKVNRDINISAAKHGQKPVSSSPVKAELKSDLIASSPSRFSNTSFNRLDEDQVATTAEDGGSEIQMYWLDYVEVDHSLVLFGKVKTNDGKLVSGMVQVNDQSQAGKDALCI
ncbi:unnamed protein product [Ambrosiozyma monospora]|uniref:Unnamed protein product n=1 Tax=Ambrosiozyma monospora TaxID=43982 RepID=A0ACB5SZE9_AMBMO|nr:unnamed protein product [Ambrosiozyma monospora]